MGQFTPAQTGNHAFKNLGRIRTTGLMRLNFFEDAGLLGRANISSLTSCVPTKCMFIPLSPFKLHEIYHLPEVGIVKRFKFRAEHDNVALVRNQSYQIDKFNLATCEGNSVVVRRSDLKVNVTHLFKASPEASLALSSLIKV